MIETLTIGKRRAGIPSESGSTGAVSQPRTRHANAGLGSRARAAGWCTVTLKICAGVTEDAREVAVDKLRTAGFGPEPVVTALTGVTRTQCTAPLSPSHD